MDDEALIKAYVGKILERSEARTTQADLDKIAAELGLGDQELARLRSFSEASKLKARNFAERKLWDDAIQALRQALAVEPLNPRLMCELASCLREKGALGDEKASKEALGLARQALEIDPGQQTAYDIIQRLGSKGGKAKRPEPAARAEDGGQSWMGRRSLRLAASRTMKRRLVIGAFIAAGIVLGGGAILFFSLRGGKGGSASSGQGGAGQRVYRPALSFEAGEWKGKLDFSLESAEVRAYKDSPSYYVSATGFFSSKDYEISALDLRAILVDQNGNTIAERASKVPAIGKTPAWPGESLGFFINFYQDTKAPRKIALRLILDSAQCNPRAESYPELRPLAALFPENAVDRDRIHFSLKRSEGTILKNGSAWVEIALLVENDSVRSIGDLSAQFTISTEGKEFSSREQRLAGTYEAAIPGKRKVLIPLGLSFDGPFGDLKPQWRDMALRISDIQ